MIVASEKLSCVLEQEWDFAVVEHVKIILIKL